MDDQATLRDLIAARAHAGPDRHYLEDARSPRVVTYADLDRLVDEWSLALSARGVDVGAGVIVDIDDPLAFAVVHLAVVASGRCSIPVDPDAPAGDLLRTVAALRPAARVSDRRRSGAAPVSMGAAAPVSMGVDIASLAPDRDSASPSPAAPGAGTVRLRTSGSTGNPKTVELTERQLIHVATGIAEHNELTPDDRGFNPLPLFHVNAEVVGLLATLVAGATLVLDRRFHRSGFWSLIEQRAITWVNAVPAILTILARDPLPARPSALRFIRSASAPLPAAVRTSIVEAFGDIVVESYGMTEAASQITATPLGEPAAAAGTAGRPVGVGVQIRSDGGRLAPIGTVGRIWIGGPGVIDAYVGGVDADRFDADGWLDTGDLGSLDAHGFLSLAGRADDVINRGGEMVYPREIEEILMADERVLDAVVVGRPDDVLGCVPVAYVIAKQPAATLADDLRELCVRQLSRFKRPAELVIVDDLPRAATGKVRRHEVRRRARAG